jgi:hypothetical membrane protein
MLDTQGGVMRYSSRVHQRHHRRLYVLTLRVAAIGGLVLMLFFVLGRETGPRGPVNIIALLFVIIPFLVIGVLVASRAETAMQYLIGSLTGLAPVVLVLPSAAWFSWGSSAFIPVLFVGVCTAAMAVRSAPWVGHYVGQD